jgi:hypothetical protein
MARWPRVYRPVKPAPMATATRPGASAARPAMAAAFTIGWRSDGTRTAGPSPIVEVRSAARPRAIQTSGYRAGES